jgi:L-iditol 2-dehydrogenase
MKSAKLVGIRQFEIFDLPAPEIGKGEVLVAIKSAGICASDVHYYHHGRIGDQVCVFPQVLGHECAGVVVKAFNGSLFNEGDRVAVEPGLSCGSCEHCLCGRYNICPNVKFLGGPGIGGAFQEFLPLDERQLHVIPADMGFDEAALLEPLGVAYHAVCLSEVKPCDTIAVFGAGAVGQLTAAMAVVCGASEIFLLTRKIGVVFCEENVRV